MEQINLKLKRTKIKLELDDKEYLISKPNYGEFLDFDKARKECGEDSSLIMEASLDFLEKLGLPKDVSKTLEISMFTQLLELLSESKKN